jgi:hypothetical protein
MGHYRARPRELLDEGSANETGPRMESERRELEEGG